MSQKELGGHCHGSNCQVRLDCDLNLGLLPAERPEVWGTQPGGFPVDEDVARGLMFDGLEITGHAVTAWVRNGGIPGL